MKDYEHTRPASSPMIRLFRRNSRTAKPENFDLAEAASRGLESYYAAVRHKADVNEQIREAFRPERMKEGLLRDYLDSGRHAVPSEFHPDIEAAIDEADRPSISDALARLHALYAEIGAIERLLSDAYERAGEVSEWRASADDVRSLDEDDLQNLDVVTELRRAVWHFSQAINKPALDHAITAVQLAELHSDFRE